MTIKSYNEWYSKCYNKALSFVLCIDHALEKSDDNAKMQMKIIGYDDDTKTTLLEALEMLRKNKRFEINGKDKKCVNIVEN